ncbi:MAG: hypothetical protein J6X22_07655 [Muribaculaceae bacterium]|nr:hypothetical protein [Muribaculaceae bacterium]
MKKTILLLLAAVLLPLAVNAQGFYAYIVDHDGPVTNVRNAPRGKVVTTLPTDKALVVTLLAAKGEWWKVGDVVDQYGDDEMEFVLRGSKTGYWIHRSLLWFGVTGDPEGALRATPSKNGKAVKIPGEPYFHPLALKGNWIKVVSTDGKCTGWLHRDRICYNPLTTCP